MKRRKENILRTSLPLFSASFVGQGVNFLLVFLLPFLFGADDIGQFFVFLAVGYILIPLVSLQSHNAIVLSRDHHVAFSNFLISIIFGALFSIIVLIFTLLFYFFPLYFSKELFSRMLFLFPFVFSGSVILSLEYFLTYLSDFKLLGVFRLVKSVFIVVIVVYGGFVCPDVKSLIFGQLAGQIIATIYAILKLRPFFVKIKISGRVIRTFVLRYKNILTYNTFITGVLMLINHSPVLILSFFFGDKVVALYGLVQRFFSTIPGSLGQSIAQVFFKKCSAFFNADQPLYETAKATIKQMGGWFFFYGLFAVFIAPIVFHDLMEPGWEDGVILTWILMPLILIQTISIPFTTLFTVLKGQKRIVWYYLGGFIMRILLGLIVPIAFFDADYKTSLIIFSFTGVLYYFFYLRELFSQAIRNDLKLKNYRNEVIEESF